MTKSNVISNQALNSLLRRLSVEGNRYQKQRATDVVVGYTAAYAVFVHEAPMTLKGEKRPTKGKFWDPQGRAQNKFLEQPARTMQRELGTIIGTIMRKRGAKLPQALLVAGLRLQRESQLLVPVDTGNLKASAFTRLIGA